MAIQYLQNNDPNTTNRRYIEFDDVSVRELPEKKLFILNVPITIENDMVDWKVITASNEYGKPRRGSEGQLVYPNLYTGQMIWNPYQRIYVPSDDYVRDENGEIQPNTAYDSATKEYDYVIAVISLNGNWNTLKNTILPLYILSLESTGRFDYKGTK